LKKSLNDHELWTPLQSKQPSVGQSRGGTAEGLNLQVEFYYGLVTNALLGAVVALLALAPAGAAAAGATFSDLTKVTRVLDNLRASA